MAFRLFIRPFSSDPGATGGGDAIDRGDNIPEDQDLDPDNPDAAKVAEEAATTALQAELDAKADKAEPSAEDEAEDARKTAAKKDARIPLSRHEAVLAKEREKRADLERQLAQFQEGKQVSAVKADISGLETDVTAMEKEYATLLADGQVDKATAVMAKIRTTERQMNAARSDMQIQAMESRAAERARFDVAVERIEASYPALNEDHADFDEALMGEVLDLKSAYETRGMSPTAALQKAVGLLAKPASAAQTAAVDATPRVPARTAGEERKAAAAAKTADAVEKTPPILAKVGLDGNKLGGGALDARAVMGMNQKDFAKLNDADLARMRGDTL